MDPIALKTRLGKTIFDIEHLSFDFDGRPMVDDFTYHVVRHDRIGIVGPNGVGKSTFMKILDGTYEATYQELLAKARPFALHTLNRNCLNLMKICVSLII